MLWRTLHPPLLRYLTVRGDEAPEDIAAETWLQVVRDLRAFRGGVLEFPGLAVHCGPAPRDRPGTGTRVAARRPDGRTARRSH